MEQDIITILIINYSKMHSATHIEMYLYLIICSEPHGPAKSMTASMDNM